MADLNDLQAAQTVKIAGASSSGAESYFMDVDSNGNAKTVVNNASGASAVNIQDGGNSITVDGTVELGATTLSALESITVQNGSGASAVNIQDGGNSITVDGILVTQGSTTSGQSGVLVQGAVTTTGPTYTTAQTSPLSLNTTGDLRVEAKNSTVVTTVPAIVKLAYDDMNVANGGVARDTLLSTTYTTIYNRSGTGYIFGFTVSLEGNLTGADEVLLKLTIDSLVVAELTTADLGTANLYNFIVAGDAQQIGWQLTSNNITFKPPGGACIRYSSSVKIEVKRAAAGSKKFRAGLIGLTKE